MAINFLPNQPIIFEPDTQTCKNNDNRAYAMLLQEGDTLHFQMTHEPCGDELLDTVGFYTGSEVLTNTDFSGSATGWTLGDWTYGTDDVSVNETNTASPLIQAISVTAGQPYKLLVNVTSYTSGTLACFVGETLAGKISSEGIHEFIFTPTIDSELRLQNDPDNVAGYQPIVMTIDLVSLTDMAIGINWASGNLHQTRQLVVNPDFNGNADGWTIENPLGAFAWFYDTNKISKPAGDSTTFYQEVDTVLNRKGYTVNVDAVVSAGSVNVYFGNVLLGNISATGSYSYEYPLPTFFDGTYPSNAIAFAPATDLFEGSISLVEIENEYIITGLTADGICKSDNTEASAIEWGTLSSFDRLSRLSMSIRGYESGTVSLTVDGVTSDAVSGNGDFTLYCLTATPITPTSSIQLNLSEDFVGCISDWSFKQYNTDHEITIMSGITPTSDIYTYASSQNPLIYHQNYITWEVDFAHVLVDEDDTALFTDCYYLRVKDKCTSTTYLSTTNISYLEGSIPCSRAVEAYCDSPAFGFDYSQGFKLFQRLRILRISPKYPIKGENYTYSSGTNAMPYSEVDKVWQCWFDYVNEETHDCIAVQLACDHFSIDSVGYYAPPQDYEPEWATNMKRNLAQSRVDLKKKTSKLYNRTIQ